MSMSEALELIGTMSGDHLAHEVVAVLPSVVSERLPAGPGQLATSAAP
jgi:hypothetical protein